MSFRQNKARIKAVIDALGLDQPRWEPKNPPEQPVMVSEQWNATERRWYVVRQWADGRVTREVL